MPYHKRKLFRLCLARETLSHRDNMSRAGLSIQGSAVVLLSLALFLSSCEDPLPPYVPPPDPLSGQVAFPRDLLVTYTILAPDPVLIVGELTPSTYAVKVGLTNTYEETLQDYADIAGTVELSWARDSMVKAIIPLSIGDGNGGLFDPITGMLTIDPGKTLWLKASWNFRLDDGTYAFTRVPFHMENFGAGLVRVHDPMVMMIRTNVRVFAKVSTIRLEICAVTLWFRQIIKRTG